MDYFPPVPLQVRGKPELDEGPPPQQLSIFAHMLIPTVWPLAVAQDAMNDKCQWQGCRLVFLLRVSWPLLSWHHISCSIVISQIETGRLGKMCVLGLYHLVPSVIQEACTPCPPQPLTRAPSHVPALPGGPARDILAHVCRQPFFRAKPQQIPKR